MMSAGGQIYVVSPRGRRLLGRVVSIEIKRGSGDCNALSLPREETLKSSRV